MRDLLVACLVILFLIGGWLLFDYYSVNEVEAMSHIITEEIIPSLESHSWDKGSEKIKFLDQKWDNYKNTAHLFIGAAQLNEIDCAMARTIEYAKSEDVSNTEVELMELAEKLSFINSQEKITLKNIF